MSKDTKQKILDTARELFNERGYNAVSLKDIADALNISKGNLTYHFRKKEELMEALLTENQLEELPNSLHTLGDLDEAFRTMEKVVGQHSYYFLNYAQLSQLSESISEMQKTNYRMIRELLLQGFRNLHTAELFRPEAFSGEYDCIVDILCVSILYWSPFESLQRSIGAYMDYRHHAWGIIYGLLTEKGRLVLSGFAQLDQ